MITIPLYCKLLMVAQVLAKYYLKLCSCLSESLHSPFNVSGMFVLLATLVHSWSPGDVHIFGVQTLQWQSLFSPVRRKVVQSGGEERVTVVLLTCISFNIQIVVM